MVKRIRMSISEYTIQSIPDYSAIGAHIDSVLKKHFLGSDLVIRALSSSEREESSLDDIASFILQHGTDIINPSKKVGRGYSKVDCDLFAMQKLITSKDEFIEPYIRNFYEQPLKHGFKPMRVDILTLYDATQMKNILYYKDKTPRFDAFAFKDPLHKVQALKAIVTID